MYTKKELLELSFSQLSMEFCKDVISDPVVKEIILDKVSIFFLLKRHIVDLKCLKLFVSSEHTERTCWFLLQTRSNMLILSWCRKLFQDAEVTYF